MGLKKKQTVVKEAFDEYGDTPEGPIAICHECDNCMEYSGRLERFRCPMCGKEIAEEDYEEYYDNNNPPFGCRTCGGPYPKCMTSCKMFDD